MRESNRNYALTVPFVEALASLGLQHVCIAPGSRNTPLSLAFAAHPDITDWSHHDERSAGFFGLGLAKATGRPVALVSTSGTAAVEFHPAAVEARYGRVPLLILTADRPPELRDVGAPQAIDQRHLFGSAVKLSEDAPVPAPTADLLRAYVRLAGRAWSTAVGDPVGPVHVNMPFREPLAPDPDPDGPLPPLPTVQRLRHRRGRLQPEEDLVVEVAGHLAGRRTLIVAGPVEAAGFPSAAADLAAAGHFPVLADPLSQLRAGSHDRSGIVATGDALARLGFFDRHPPEVVVRFGGPPTSKAVGRWLADHPQTLQVVVDVAGWRDPHAAAGLVLHADPALTASALAKALATPAPPDWRTTWIDADRVVSRALRTAIEAAGFPNEPLTAVTLAEAIPAGSTLHVASSMPIRDVDGFVPVLDRPVRFTANRGANGIDGFISSGLGIAAAGDGPTYLLAGDLSLLHDLTSLATAVRLEIPATIVVIDNDGGGIFHFLPQAAHPEFFERHLGTPHGLDFVRLSEAFGLPASTAATVSELQSLVADPPAGPRLVVVQTDRARNVDVHRAAWEAAAAALV